MVGRQTPQTLADTIRMALEINRCVMDRPRTTSRVPPSPLTQTGPGRGSVLTVGHQVITVPSALYGWEIVKPAGFFFVKKKEGTLHPCIDYRGLNQVTIKDRHPLPLLNTVLDSLLQASIFTRLDLPNAYNLVRIREGNEWKKAFSTPTGHWEYLMMPFGLCNSPAVFQRFFIDVLRDMLGCWVFVYLDDILVYSKPEVDHIQHVQAVLQSLLQNHLYCKLEKCSFHQSTTTFLGYVIPAGRISMDPQKVTAITEWPVPTTIKQLQSFLGFANFYRRFIHNYSTIVAPLTTLTRSTDQPRPFALPPEAERIFHRVIRLALASAVSKR
uniref:ribonuclease H n=1 Tax=Iconisemion striatum TaxID=60296 RepID=A0A1A7Z1B0_9TELE